jgi:precorrin-6A/cobalt-precorrin-6A reductase
MTRHRVLILGGTVEGAELARRLATNERLDVITSLAGRTRRFQSPPGHIRIGGFGGVEGLDAYLRDQKIEFVVDTTHPFAATMARHAAVACDAIGVPRLKIVRQPWQEQTGDRWTRVPNADAAAAKLAGWTGCVLLTVGRQELKAFEGLPGPRFVARMIELPDAPPSFEVILARGPFGIDDELRLLRDRAVTALVSKNSGGEATAAKLEAARRLSIPVVMIERPAPPHGERMETAAEAAAWIEARLA